MENNMEVPLKSRTNYHMIQKSHDWHIPGENHNSEQYLSSSVYCGAVYNNQDMDAT